MKRLIWLILIMSVAFGQIQLNEKLRELLGKESADQKDEDLNITKSFQDPIYLESTIDESEYIVGPGDLLALNMISADGVLTYDLLVSPTGHVLVPAIGTLPVDGLTLEKAIAVITDACLDKYSNASIYISLVALRRFKVLVIGTVNSPGYVVVTPLTRVSEIYQQVKGSDDNELAAYITSRNIRLKRGGDILNVDLLKYQIFGDTDMNPRVIVGDVIEIGMIRDKIGIYGGVQLPGSYEYAEDETLESLIQLAGGFKNNADPSKIEITRFVNDTDRVVINISRSEDIQSTLLAPEDHIVVRLKQDYKRQDLASVFGEVKFPGSYSIDEGVTTIGDLIQKAGGYSLRADQTQITVNNKSISKLVDIELERISLIPFENLSDPERAYLKARMRNPKGEMSSASAEFTRLVYQFPLQRDDVIHIPAQQRYVEVLGAVLHPGRYPLQQGYSYLDYIQQAGGITADATRNKYLIKNSTGQRIKLKEKVEIENGDVIFIAEKLEYNKWERFKDIMTIGGQMAAIIIVIQNAIGK